MAYDIEDILADEDKLALLQKIKGLSTMLGAVERARATRDSATIKNEPEVAKVDQRDRERSDIQDQLRKAEEAGGYFTPEGATRIEGGFAPTSRESGFFMTETPRAPSKTEPRGFLGGFSNIGSTKRPLDEGQQGNVVNLQERLQALETGNQPSREPKPEKPKPTYEDEVTVADAKKVLKEAQAAKKDFPKDILQKGDKKARAAYSEIIRQETEAQTVLREMDQKYPKSAVVERPKAQTRDAAADAREEAKPVYNLRQGAISRPASLMDRVAAPNQAAPAIAPVQATSAGKKAKLPDGRVATFDGSRWVVDSGETPVPNQAGPQEKGIGTRLIEHITAPERGGAFYDAAQGVKRFMNQPSEPLINKIIPSGESPVSSPDPRKDRSVATMRAMARGDLPTPGYGNRTDGTPKGTGFFGELQRPDGKVSTELAIGVNFDGQEVEIPSLVPTLTQEEIDYLLSGGKPTPEIVQKAVVHAKQRMTQGRSPFAEEGEQRPPSYRAGSSYRGPVGVRPEVQSKQAGYRERPLYRGVIER